MNVSHMKKSILKRTVFGVFLVLLMAMICVTPVMANADDDDIVEDEPYYNQYCSCANCPLKSVYDPESGEYVDLCSDTCNSYTGCPCGPSSSSDSSPKSITPMYFYVNMPDGYDGRVLTIALNGLPLPAEKKAIAAIEMDITKPMNEGEIAEVIARIPGFVLKGLDVDPSHFALYHLVNGEWVKMDVTISYAKDGDLLIETTASSFGVFVVVVETA